MKTNNFHKSKNCNDDCCGLCCTKIEGFSVNIGNTEILKDINIHIHCGELTAIIGPNGSGKSTLLKTILGELKHYGSLNFLDAKGARNGSPLIGYVPQNLNLDNSSPTSVLDLFAACRTRYPTWLYIPKKVKNNVLEILKNVKAEHLIDRRLGALSGGELQRVLLSLAIEPIPDLLLLDEPVSGIDQNGMEIFYKMVSDLRNKFDLSIILVSHDLDLVRKYADRVILLNKTIISNGAPEEVMTSDSFYEIFSMKWHNEMKTNDINNGG